MFDKNKFKIHVIAAILLFVLVIMFIVMMVSRAGQSNNNIVETNIIELDYSESGPVFIDYMSSEVIYLDKDVDIDDYKVSDKDFVVAYTSGGELYVFSGELSNKISDSLNLVDYFISQYGDYIYYTIGNEGDGYDLYSYSVRRDESELVQNNIFYDFDKALIPISPDGKTVGYSIAYDLSQEIDSEKSDKDVSDDRSISSGKVTGYIKTIGKDPELLGDDLIPLGLTNKGDITYYLDMDYSGEGSSLYVNSNGNTNKLLNNVTDHIDLLFSYDYSQVIYNDGGDAFLCIAGQKEVQLADSTIYVPTNFKNIKQITSYHNLTDIINLNIAGINIKKFSDIPFIDSEKNLFYLSEDYQVYEMDKGVEIARVSDNFISMAYSDNAFKIHYIKDTLDIVEGKEIQSYNVEGYVEKLFTNTDASEFAYLNRNLQIVYIKGIQLMYEDVVIIEKPTAATFFSDTNRLMIIADDKLYTSKNGRDMEEIDMGGQVLAVENYQDRLYCVVNSDKVRTYVSSNGEDFDLLYTHKD